MRDVPALEGLVLSVAYLHLRVRRSPVNSQDRSEQRRTQSGATLDRRVKSELTVHHVKWSHGTDADKSDYKYTCKSQKALAILVGR